LNKWPTLTTVALSGINLTLSMYRSKGSFSPVGFGSPLSLSLLWGTQGSSIGLWAGDGVGNTGVGILGVGCLKNYDKT